MAGELMLARARETGARLLPIDSEHCALHECLDGRRPEDVRRLLLTASGRPVPQPARARASPDITREEALAHPTWRMGPQDHDRLGDPHEQGPRGDRGALALRRRGREDRRARPPAVGRPLDGGARGRHGARAARGDRHAHADPVRAQLPREVGGGDPGHGLHEGDAARLRAARPREVPLPRARLPRARGRAARRPRRSTPRTRRRWPPSSTAGRRSSPSPSRSRKSSTTRAADGRSTRSRTCSRPTAGRGSAPGRPSRGARPRARDPLGSAPERKRKITWAF